MISFIIPALNESKFISTTLETINTSVSKVENIKEFEIIIVDDCSKDSTEEAINDLKIQYNNIVFIKNEKNYGMGFSIKRGIKLAKYSKFMILPGGNDVNSNSIVSSLKFYNTADLVMQYPLNTEERSKFRNIMSKIYSLIYIIFFDCNVNYINGCSIFPTKKVLELKLNSNRHGILSEIVTKLLRENITYCEVPVFYKFPRKVRSTINFKSLIDVIRSFIFLFIDLKIKNKTSIKSKRKNITY